MPDRTACKYCGKVGFIRRERVLKAGRSSELFYCGSCNRSWVINEHAGDRIENRSRDDQPPRS